MNASHNFSKLIKSGIIIGLEYALYDFKFFPAETAIKHTEEYLKKIKTELAELETQDKQEKP